jgi:septal ring factor EnvC (AmiA/AmiB activator)
VDELRPIWEKIDDHQRAINEQAAWRQTTEYRISQMETRFDQSLKDSARAFGELAHAVKEVSKEVSEIHAEQMRQMGRIEAMNEAKRGQIEAERIAQERLDSTRKESADWKRWLWPTITGTLMLLAALGIIQGPNG